MGGRERGVRVAEGRGGKGNEVTKSTCEEEVVGCITRVELKEADYE